jgi:small nuclear ribonucleoprotein (snRNP)-like protein|tara:strand:+ start:999 stop:1310 length:312 start_codon:yes stop_codon:yes gene_type:complete
LFHSFFSELLVKKEENNLEEEGQKTLLTIHLKNGIKITGLLLSMDQNMNIQLGELDHGSLPKQFQGLKSMYIRGNAIRQISLDKTEIGEERIQKLTSDCRLNE